MYRLHSTDVDPRRAQDVVRRRIVVSPPDPRDAAGRTTLSDFSEAPARTQ